MAEFAAHLSRDVLAHIDLAAEARVKKPRQQSQPDESDTEEEDETTQRKRPQIELVDMGGGDSDDIMDGNQEVPLGEVSSFPLTDVPITLALCFQEADVNALDEKKGRANLMFTCEQLTTPTLQSCSRISVSVPQPRYLPRTASAKMLRACLHYKKAP